MSGSGGSSCWRLAAESRAVEAVRVRKFVSERSGLTLVLADVEGPVVNGFFALATEAHDDDGLPHTLEHLIFLGSKRYPYKGILDLLANRCLANGTNAWTDTDHTCYTIRTAGAAGMLTLLPIYLDHILNPTLTEHGFTTEVHHVDNEGEDAGVVYCEMQGRENMADSRCYLTLSRNIYPDHGYSAETGGIMKNLRSSTDNEKVRAYHKKFYRPENLTIILTGQIDPEDVFKALKVVEDDIIAKNAAEPLEPWERPWQSRPPPPHYGEFKVEWPADTEDCGQVELGWTGPSLDMSDSLKQLAACAVLLRYLCESPTAPLRRHLVEKEDAIAGDISYNIRENRTSLLVIELDNVPVGKIGLGRTEALECLKKIREGEEPLDMTRMKRLLKKQLRENLASLESDPHHAIAFHCIGDMLYSRNEEDFVTRLNSHKILTELMSEPQEYWVQLLQKYFGEELVVVMGYPSIDLQTKMADEEKKRIEAQSRALGPAGLAEKAKLLKEALEFNEREPPAGTLSDVPIPSCSELNCYNVSTWATGDCCPHLELSAMPLYTRVHTIPTNFIYMNLVFDLTDVDRLTRRWLPTIVASWGECPIRRGDDTVPYQQVVSELEELAVKYDNQIGFGRPGNFSVGHFGNNAYIEVTCEQSADYDKLVALLWETLHAALITKERLLVIAQRLINDVAQVRRRGNKMAYDILRDSLYSEDSNIHWCSVLRQQKFLTELVEKLNAGGAAAEAVLSEAAKAYREISSKVWLHLATDLEKFKPSAGPWERWAKENEIEPLPPTLSWDGELMSGWGGGCVVGVGGVESNYLVQLCPGPLSFAHADLPALLVLLNYFTQLEGPMWRLIRGCGLAYSYGIMPVQNEGRIMFSLYKATNIVGAYCKAKSIIEEYLSGGVLDPDLFASAKSSTIFEVVDEEKCPADVARGSLLNYFRRADDNYSKKLVCALMEVSAERAQEVATRWLPTLFDHAQCKTTVICHPSKVQDTRDAFHKIGVELEAYESIESSHFNNVRPCDLEQVELCKNI